jgi:hypothetical protein
MGLLNAGLAALTVGYSLGVWTACTIYSRAARAGDHGTHALARRLNPEVTWISERRT